MVDWASLLRPELAELAAYKTVDAPGARVRLDANEAPAPTSRAVHDAVLRAVERSALHRYPDGRMRELRARIAERTGARPDELLVGTGSDEIIAILLTALARPRERSPRAPCATVLAPTPTFVMYRINARARGMHPVEVPLDSRWDLDVRAMERAIEMTRPNVVFIASPNNPTANRMSDDRLASVIEAASDSLVVVDEAYADFAGRSLRSWRERYPWLAIMRTLSKVGLAALRVGWLEADEALVRELDKVRQPYNVSATSQAAAAAVLSEAWEDVSRHVAAVVQERDRVASALRGLVGVDVPAADANFLWVGTPAPAERVHEGLLARGVLVKTFHSSGGRLADRLRVTVGSREENDAFLEAFAQVLRDTVG